MSHISIYLNVWEKIVLFLADICCSWRNCLQQKAYELKMPFLYGWCVSYVLIKNFQTSITWKSKLPALKIPVHPFVNNIDIRCNWHNMRRSCHQLTITCNFHLIHFLHYALFENIIKPFLQPCITAGLLLLKLVFVIS